MTEAKKKISSASSKRWLELSSGSGSLQELKQSAADIRRKAKKETRIFTNYSLTDGGEKISKAS